MSLKVAVALSPIRECAAISEEFSRILNSETQLI